MNRKRLNFKGQHEVLDFILKMKNETDEYVLEDFKGWLRVNAQSINGALYAVRDFDDVYIMNVTNHGEFPSFIGEFEDGNCKN